MHKGSQTPGHYRTLYCSESHAQFKRNNFCNLFWATSLRECDLYIFQVACLYMLFLLQIFFSVGFLKLYNTLEGFTVFHSFCYLAASAFLQGTRGGRHRTVLFYLYNCPLRWTKLWGKPYSLSSSPYVLPCPSSVWLTFIVRLHTCLSIFPAIRNLAGQRALCYYESWCSQGCLTPWAHRVVACPPPPPA